MWAERIGNEYILEIPGGMSRYYLFNEEGFIMSICHELGHLLGGEPKRGQISLEGQSDYFAGNQCIRKVLTAVAPYKKLTPTSEVKSECARLPKAERSLCHRSLLGALSLTSYYAELEKRAAPQISSPSKTVVNKTLKVHPPSQCRLDTIVAGYFSKKRPRCWYKP